MCLSLLNDIIIIIIIIIVIVIVIVIIDTNISNISVL